MSSIRQNRALSRLPDFRNLGVMLRILLGVNVFALLAAIARGESLARVGAEFLSSAAMLEPALIFVLLLIYGASPYLAELPYRAGAALVTAVAVAGVLVVARLLAPLAEAEGSPAALLRYVLWTLLAVGTLLYYFRLRERAISPALAEARLMALTARIRPHFLFNSLNAVLGVIRSDSRRAERALEELCDLFRVLMAENRDLVPLSQEIALSRQYLDLERLRLGDRLQVEWQIESCPPDALVPPLMLQPLLENAVYHGIEPADEPGKVAVFIGRSGDEVQIRLENPYHGAGSNHPGNRMALDNIRERLMLFFDLEARLTTEASGGVYRVFIRLPYRRKS